MWSSAKGYASTASTRRGSSSSPRCVPCPHWFQDPPGAAISGNQWRSVAISGNQWPPVAISWQSVGNQWQSVAISGNQWQSVAELGQRHSVAIKGHRGHQRHSLPQVHNCPASSMHAVHAPPHAIICTRTPASGPSTNLGMRSVLFKPCPSRPYLHAQSERPSACHISQSGRRHQHAPSARPSCTIREAIREVIREDTSEAIREAFRETIGNLSARNQHAISTQSARNQHAIRTQSARNQHAISTQSARNQHAISMHSYLPSPQVYTTPSSRERAQL